MNITDRDPDDPGGRSLADTGRCCGWRHANAVPPWTCDCPCHVKIEDPYPVETLDVIVEEFVGWWHLNREGSVNKTYDYVDKIVKRMREAL